MNKKNAKGFSLIEILVAVSILTILTTIGIVSYRKWIITATMKEARSMIMILYEEAYKYKNKTGAYKPCTGPFGSDTSCIKIYKRTNLKSYAKHFSYEIRQESSNEWVIVANSQGTGGIPPNKELKFFLTGVKEGQWDGSEEFFK